MPPEHCDQFWSLICHRPTSRECLASVFWLTMLALPPLSCLAMHSHELCFQPLYLAHQVEMLTELGEEPQGQPFEQPPPGQFAREHVLEELEEELELDDCEPVLELPPLVAGDE